MDIITILEFFTHMDLYIQSKVSTIGIWPYLLIFLIIFLGTAFIFLSFFPGKSLIFIIGVLCANGTLNVYISIFILVLATFSGDIINYYMGRFGSKAFNTDSKFLKKEYLIRANKFYEKYGLSTILITKFISVIRIVAIFVAGMAKMNYKHFLKYTLLGDVTWVMVSVLIGFFLGTIPIIKDNLIAITAIIVIISLIPGFLYSEDNA